MKLSYRGVNYESQPSTLEFNEGEVGGKYRGQTWKYRYPRHIPQLKPKIYRQYRGVAYSTCPISANQPSVNTSNESVPQTSYCRIPAKKQSQSDLATEIHQENIRRSLERRLASAKARGDQDLINLLQKECEQLHLV